MSLVMKVIATCAIVIVSTVAAASELTAATSRAIVERQFDAFERDDEQAAYALADPAIKDMFSDAGHFMAMVRDHYGPVYRHRSVEFGAFKDRAMRRPLKRPSSTTTTSCGRRSTPFGARRSAIG